MMRGNPDASRARVTLVTPSVVVGLLMILFWGCNGVSWGSLVVGDNHQSGQPVGDRAGAFFGRCHKPASGGYVTRTSKRTYCCPPTRGFVVLGQKHPADPNGLSRLVIVSYDKRSPGNTVTAQNRIISNPTTANGVTKVTLSPAPPVGSPLIVAKNGSWAKIIEVNDSNCVLDHMIDTGGSNDAFIIVEESGSITLAKSPAMAVLVSDVMLQQ